MPGLRLLNVGCRSCHIVAFSALLGGSLWGVPADRLAPALWATIASGLALAAAETLAGRSWMVETRGVLVLAKLGLLVLVPFAGEHGVTVLVAVTVLASVSSHLPSRFRHAVLIPGWREPGALETASVPAHPGAPCP